MKLYEFFNVPVDKRQDKFPNYPGQSLEDKEKMSDELFWFIIDHDSLHKEFVLPFVKDMKDQVTNPNFDKGRFTKGWMPMVRKGCSLFYKKKKLKDDPKDLFDDKVKEEICRKLCDKFVQEIKDGDFFIGDHKK
jgi:hypothetical protein